MPSMASITVKKADGTTDITYTALQASAGDGVPAIWRSETAGSAPGFKPVLKLMAKPSQDGKTRRVDYEFSYPQTVTDSTTSVTSVINKPLAKGYFVEPIEVPDTVNNEFVSQCLNLLGSTLFRDSVKAGYAPT